MKVPNKVLDVLLGARPAGSELVRMMVTHHDAFASVLVRADWVGLAARLNAIGLRNAYGRELTAATVRQAWWRARKLVAARRSRRVREKDRGGVSTVSSAPAPSTPPASLPSATAREAHNGPSLDAFREAVLRLPRRGAGGPPLVKWEQGMRDDEIKE